MIGVHIEYRPRRRQDVFRLDPVHERRHRLLIDGPLPRGLVLLAVSVDEKPAAYEGFVKKLNPPFVTLLDREQKLVRAVRVPTMPTSYLLDRTGRVRFVHEGFHGEATEREVRKEIETLLAEKKPTS